MLYDRMSRGEKRLNLDLLYFIKKYLKNHATIPSYIHLFKITNCYADTVASIRKLFETLEYDINLRDKRLQARNIKRACHWAAHSPYTPSYQDIITDVSQLELLQDVIDYFELDPIEVVDDYSFHNIAEI